HAALGLGVDVTQAAAVAAAAERTARELGPVSVLVNNAGVVAKGDFASQDEADWTRTMGVNLHSYLLVTKAFLPAMTESGGRLVFVASAAGLLGVAGMAVYSASKHAVVGFADSLRLELARSAPGKVGVTIVCPSFIATGMFDGAAPPRGTRWLTADEVAGRALKASARGRVWVREPALVKLVPFVRTLPTRLSDRLSRLLGIHSSMDGFRGRA
ncbi:MAG: SDR family NAD(P)-dependent oxidoreductase, partial [Elusimicrobia bacterium]|nr:SDR family NAD(P)-dependent oxidoreductase [Elusimicrobiota bacterium]